MSATQTGKNIRRNAIAGASQTALSAILLFCLYRYINYALGVEYLGVWSVVLALSSVSSLADLGFSAGLTKFVAKYVSLNRPFKVVALVDTVTISMAMVIILLTLIMLPLAYYLSDVIFDDPYSHFAKTILPIAFISVVFNITASASLGGLAGLGRIDAKSLLLFASQAIFLLATFVLVPLLDFEGLAFAQLLSSFFLLVTARLVLRYNHQYFTIIPVVWRVEVISEIWRYGAQYQLALVMRMLLDPVTKGLLASFAGPLYVGYFEMATQIIAKAKNMLVSANHAIVPYVSSNLNNQQFDIKEFYCSNFEIFSKASLLLFSLIVSCAGLMSWILLGENNSVFILLFLILSFAWMLNSFSGPAHLLNLATGKLWLSTISTLLMAISNIFFCSLLGFYLGGLGVAIGYALSITLGGLLLLWLVNRDLGLMCKDVFSSWMIFHIVIVVLAICNATYLFYLLEDSQLIYALLFPVAVIMLVFVAVFVDPILRKIVLGILMRSISKD
ncbi:MAG: O-antigen/teichoic acid export membrane protein [Halieaceae bacterium]|jgi:O-antigen/teichoic acid export membrane protein